MEAQLWLLIQPLRRLYPPRSQVFWVKGSFISVNAPWFVDIMAAITHRLQSLESALLTSWMLSSQIVLECGFSALLL